jgi:hypothetical protein
MHGLADRRAYGVALEGRFGQAYNEQAFRYFLQLERKRAARAKRPVLLFLLSLKKPATNTGIDPVLASRLFDCLCGCLRETDVIGWYREDRIMGAVLTNVDGECSPEVTAIVRRRVDEALAAGLVTRDIARQLRLRVYHCRPQLKG